MSKIELVQPLNSLDDPFCGLSDDQLTPDNNALQEQYILNQLQEDMTRGTYSLGRIREKYLGVHGHTPYPWLTEKRLAELLQIAANNVVNDNPLDVRMEISGYLSSNHKLQASLWTMLDDATDKGQLRLSKDIIATLHTLKKDRIDFIEKTGVKLAEQAKDPSKPGMLPPGAIPIADLLSEGAKIEQRTEIPAIFEGVLESGDIAEVRRSGSTSTKVEGKQDPVDSAGILPN